MLLAFFHLLQFNFIINQLEWVKLDVLNSVLAILHNSLALIFTCCRYQSDVAMAIAWQSEIIHPYKHIKYIHKRCVWKVIRIIILFCVWDILRLQHISFCFFELTPFKRYIFSSSLLTYQTLVVGWFPTFYVGLQQWFASYPAGA
jgi:hypothetical protein